MSAPGGIGANAFDEGTWYHEILEDGLALSYRVRVLSAPIVFSAETDGGGNGARRSRAGHPGRKLRNPEHGLCVHFNLASRFLVLFPSSSSCTQPQLTRASRPCVDSDTRRRRLIG